MNVNSNTFINFAKRFIQILMMWSFEQEVIGQIKQKSSKVRFVDEAGLSNAPPNSTTSTGAQIHWVVPSTQLASTGAARPWILRRPKLYQKLLPVSLQKTLSSKRSECGTTDNEEDVGKSGVAFTLKCLCVNDIIANRNSKRTTTWRRCTALKLGVGITDLAVLSLLL